jgi:sulfide:quinone oxidoreductase
MAHVVILGGGFGGLEAAHELRAALPEAEITLVDRTDRFYMGFAKLWDLAGIRPLTEGTGSLAHLESRGIHFRLAEITRIDPDQRRVETTDGTLEGDALVVALGAVAPQRHLDLLQGTGAHDLYDAGQLPSMRQALAEIDGGVVLIAILGVPFKCPPAPFEATLIVDELLRRRGARDHIRVAIATPQPMTLPVAGPDASRYLAGFLGDRDIELLEKHAVRDIAAGPRIVRFEDGSELEYRLLLGVPACAPPAVVRESALAGPSGWIEPDRHTLRTAFERVYAVGDCTLVATAKGQLPKAGVFAAGEAQVAARNIAADLGSAGRSTFDGHGFCFLEVPGRRVALVDGNFYAEPNPEVRLTEADEEQFRRKQAFEREHLLAWLG